QARRQPGRRRRGRAGAVARPADRAVPRVRDPDAAPARPQARRAASLDARGGRPPLPEPPLCLGPGGRLRRIPSGLSGASSASGSRTHTLGPSPCLRCRRTPPPSGTLGAPAAHPFGATCCVGGVWKTVSYARAKPLLTWSPGSFLHV